jgi:hypothetical protein
MDGHGDKIDMKSGEKQEKHKARTDRYHLWTIFMLNILCVSMYMINELIVWNNVQRVFFC